MKINKKIWKFLIPIIVILFIGFIFIYFTNDNKVKNYFKKHYGIQVSIDKKETKDNIITYHLNWKENNIKITAKLNKELDFSKIETNAEQKINEFFCKKLQKQHKNLTIEHSCFVLNYHNWNDIPDTVSALKHINDYLKKQNYYKFNGNISFIKVIFDNSVNINQTKTEFVIGKIKESQIDSYKEKIYTDDSAEEILKKNYINGTQLFNKEDTSIPSESYNKNKKVMVVSEKGSSILDNYLGYFTFTDTIKVLKDMNIEVIGDENAFTILSNENIYEFSLSFIDGPHTYYIVNGRKENLSTEENLISPLIMNDIIPITIKDYKSISEVTYNDVPIDFTFFMNEEENEPYLPVNELSHLFNVLGISYEGGSFYQVPYLTWKLDKNTYSFDLSYGKHYRNQKGEFETTDNYYYIKDKEQYPLGRIIKNQLTFDELEILTNRSFTYNNNHTISIKEK